MAWYSTDQWLIFNWPVTDIQLTNHWYSTDQWLSIQLTNGDWYSTDQWLIIQLDAMTDIQLTHDWYSPRTLRDSIWQLYPWLIFNCALMDWLFNGPVTDIQLTHDWYSTDPWFALSNDPVFNNQRCEIYMHVVHKSDCYITNTWSAYNCKLVLKDTPPTLVFLSNWYI